MNGFLKSCAEIQDSRKNVITNHGQNSAIPQWLIRAAIGAGPTLKIFVESPESDPCRGGPPSAHGGWRAAVVGIRSANQHGMGPPCDRGVLRQLRGYREEQRNATRSDHT